MNGNAEKWGGSYRPEDLLIKLAGSPFPTPTLTSDSATRITPHPKGRGVVWGQSVFRNIQMEPYTFAPGGRYRTFRYLSAYGATIQDSAVVASFLHGMNAKTSHAGAMLNAVQTIARPGKNSPPGSALNLACQKTARMENVYAEAIDLPGCGNNSDASPLDTLEGTLNFYIEYLKDLRQRSRGQGVIVVARSYSVGYVVEANRLVPGLVNGLVLAGGIQPDAHIGFTAAIVSEKQQLAAGTLTANEKVRSRTNNTYGQLTWGNEKDPFGGIETLLLFGEHDPYQTDVTRKYFRELSARNTHVRYRDVLGGAHGVFGPIPKRPASQVDVMVEINELILRVGRRR